MDSKVLTEDIIPNLKAKVDSVRKIAYYHIQFENISDSPSSSDIVYSTLAEQVQQGYQIVFLVTRTDSTTSINNETWFMQRYYNVYNSAPFNGIILEMTCSGVDTFRFPEAAPLNVIASYIVKVSSDDSSLSVSKYTAATTDLSNVQVGSVTNRLLDNKAVQDHNIDWAKIGGGVWSVFSNTDPTTRDLHVDTLKNTPLTLHVENLGTTFRIDQGARNIRLIRNYWCCRYDGTTTGNFGVNNVWTDSDIYTYIYGKSDNGTYSSCGSAVGTTDSGQSYGELAGAMSGVKSGAMSECVMMRMDATRWVIHGKIIATGSSSIVSYSTEVTAKNQDCSPAIYQRHAPESAQSVLNVLEVFEEN